MEIPVLYDITVIFTLSAVVLFVCHHLHIAPIVGFLITGVLAGHSGANLVEAEHQVEMLAEVGVVLLLFSIGIELSIKTMVRIARPIFLGGGLQLAVTVGATALIASIPGTDIGTAVFTGCLVALSSTAIVMRVLQEKGDIDSPHGRSILGILVFQDLAAVPLILLTPIMAGQSGNVGLSLLALGGKGLAILVFTYVSARWVVPYLLYQVARTRNQTLFLLVIIVLCMGIAWLTNQAGLSLALGAFLAGLIISESEYSHHALSNILPFREAFASLFFVSIGMLLDVSVLYEQPFLVGELVIGVLALKMGVGALVGIALGLPLRATIAVAMAICQIGEFSFILSKYGVDYGLLSPESYQLFLAVSILSMAATPFLMPQSDRMAMLAGRMPLPRWLVTGLTHGSGDTPETHLRDHVVIVGYGLAGRSVARAARATGIRYAIIDMNPQTVRIERGKGEPIHYGDASHEEVLRHVGIGEARVAVVAINDAAATRRAVFAIHQANPRAHLIVRSRYTTEMASLYDLGAHEVIPEEFEASVEVFTRVLTKYLIPRHLIQQFTTEARSGRYEMLRTPAPPTSGLGMLSQHLTDMDMAVIRIEAGAPIAGKTLIESDFRRKYGLTVLAVRSGDITLANPSGETVLQAGDDFYLFGRPEQLTDVSNLFQREHN